MIAMIAAVLSMLSCPSSVCAQGAMIEVIDNHHDFGDIWINDRVTHAFKIRNTGDAELELLHAVADCPCITFVRFDRRIAPGKTGEVRIELDTSDYIYGRFTKRIQVSTNVPSTPGVELIFKGVIREYIARSPVGAGFAQLEPDQTAEQTIKLVNQTSDAATLTLDSPPNMGCFSASLTEDKPGFQWSLRVTAAPPYQSYMNEATIRLTSSIPKQPVVTVRCTAYVPPRLELRPHVLVAQPAFTLREVLFINHDEQPVRVTGVLCDDPRVRADVVEEQAGKRYKVRIVMPLAYEPPDRGNVITITTDDPGEPRLELRLVSQRASDDASTGNRES